MRHDARGKSRTFRVGDSIFLKNYGAGSGWLPGKIIQRSGPVSFQVLLEDGRRKRCHQDQLRPRVVEDGPPEMSEVPVDADTSDSTSTSVPSAADSTVETSSPVLGPDLPEPPVPAQSNRTPSSESSVRRYPSRQRKPRVWFEPGKD